jgi:hypothetical protein
VTAVHARTIFRMVFIGLPSSLALGWAGRSTSCRPGRGPAPTHAHTSQRGMAKSPGEPFIQGRRIGSDAHPPTYGFGYLLQARPRPIKRRTRTDMPLPGSRDPVAAQAMCGHVLQVVHSRSRSCSAHTDELGSTDPSGPAGVLD